ncbi:MAG: hypothetical protein OCD00_14930 [Colwellia sp.]
MKFFYGILLMLSFNVLAVESFYYKNNQKIELSFLRLIETENKHIRLYKNENGINVGVSEQLIVKATSLDVLQPYLKELNLVLIKKLTGNVFLLKTKNVNSTITIVNILAKKKYIQYAQPDFIKITEKR